VTTDRALTTDVKASHQLTRGYLTERKKLVLRDIIERRINGKTCSVKKRRLRMLNDFLSSGKYADVKTAAEDRSEWRGMNSSGMP